MNISHLTEGEPSLCYQFHGDGQCEDFELNHVIEDCGHQTPEGVVNQWAVSAQAGPGYPDPFSFYICSVDVIVGPPDEQVFHIYKFPLILMV